jgi:predicted MPP superfamily phosphohydrolase
VLTESEVVIPGLDPAHDGVRIAQLSDVHVGRMTPEEHVRAAVDLANEAAPDVTVMTGDYVCWRRREIPMMEEQLAGIRGRVVVTLGNHDYFASGRRVARGLEKIGYEVLRNRNVSIDIGGEPLNLIGIDDPVTRHHDVEKAFDGVPDGGSRVVLCHCPEQVDHIAEKGAHLVLSGHTHGGQIFVRGITDRIARGMGRRFLGGFYEIGRTLMYVTPGVGFSGVRWRVGEGTQAEVSVFTLRAA